MDGFAGEIEDLKNTENLSNTTLKISRVQAKRDKVDSEQLIVLTYLGIYFLYLIIEAVHLMIRRSLSCSAFKKNLSPKKEVMDGMENVWLNGVSEFNALVRADTSHSRGNLLRSVPSLFLQKFFEFFIFVFISHEFMLHLGCI